MMSQNSDGDGGKRDCALFTCIVTIGAAVKVGHLTPLFPYVYYPIQMPGEWGGEGAWRWSRVGWLQAPRIEIYGLKQLSLAPGCCGDDYPARAKQLWSKSPHHVFWLCEELGVTHLEL